MPNTPINPPPIPPATVLITSKNRKDELYNAIRSALSQTLPVEVLVIDDGSSDGTSEMVRREFPDVRLHHEEASKGYIHQRNYGARLARAAYVFSMDDDAVFSTPNVVAQTLAEFNHPRVGAVAIPFINVKQDNKVRQQTPDPSRVYAAESYIGTAHALRRDLFEMLGGYRAFLVHQGEEGDYCIRMLNAGYITRLGSSDPIHHFESPRRDFRRMDYYGRRNDLLNAWCNVPLGALAPHMVGTTINGLRLGFRIRRPWHMVKGIAAGWGCCISRWGERDPVAMDVYRLSRRLKKAGPLRLEEIEPLLPPMAAL
ncbi:MAG: glycosyltransferase [Planctomycetes bacterium]|nr:glycosyltransferase [Planctomycetota bacterium]